MTSRLRWVSASSSISAFLWSLSSKTLTWADLFWKASSALRASQWIELVKWVANFPGVLFPRLFILCQARTLFNAHAAKDSSALRQPDRGGNNWHTKQKAASLLIEHSRCGYVLNHSEENWQCFGGGMSRFLGYLVSFGWKGPCSIMYTLSSSVNSDLKLALFYDGDARPEVGRVWTLGFACISPVAIAVYNGSWYFFPS
jgi:hypothetical protein